MKDLHSQHALRQPLSLQCPTCTATEKETGYLHTQHAWQQPCTKLQFPAYTARKSLGRRTYSTQPSTTYGPKRSRPPRGRMRGCLRTSSISAPPDRRSFPSPHPAPRVAFTLTFNSAGPLPLPALLGITSGPAPQDLLFRPRPRGW